MALAIVDAFAAMANAQDGLPITISGFGTGALTRTDSDGAEFSRLTKPGVFFHPSTTITGRRRLRDARACGTQAWVCQRRHMIKPRIHSSAT